MLLILIALATAVLNCKSEGNYMYITKCRLLQRLLVHLNLSVANSVCPDQTAPLGAV